MHDCSARLPLGVLYRFCQALPDALQCIVVQASILGHRSAISRVSPRNASCQPCRRLSSAGFSAML